MHVCARACVHARVCACVLVCVINENKHPFQDFCCLINHSWLIYRRIALMFVMWDHSLLFLCIGDVVKGGAYDHVIQLRLSIFT